MIELARKVGLAAGQATCTLEGHTGRIWGVAVTPDGRHAITASRDCTARVWDLSTGQATGTLDGHTSEVLGVAVTPDGRHAITASRNGILKVWAGIGESRIEEPGGVYINAKVVLVGESQAGKSGLARVLAGRDWASTESTIGAWATQLLLPASASPDPVEREVWLWDFGGQADQRLIHQLFLKDARLAVLVFDGQRDDAVQRVWDWNRAITPRDHDLPRLLVAARTDINAVRLNSGEVDRLRTAAGFVDYLETSAKTGRGVAELRQRITTAIDWSTVPYRSSPAVFRRLKAAIIGLKDRGYVLTTVKQLLDWLPDQVGPFSLAELQAVIGLLAGPGAVMCLGFDDQVLLQPELLNAYGQAVIRTLGKDPEERGCLPEQRLLDGELDYPPGFERLSGAEEAMVLRGLQQELVRRALCIRDDDPAGRNSTLLVFPSYFRRQRPERPQEPNVFTTYRFDGPLEEVYSTLVVRLHHTTHFTSSELWRDVADLRSLQSRQGMGVRLRKEPDGSGRIDLFADPQATRADRQVLTRFTHDHLHRYATQVQRFRIYNCPSCGTPAKDLDLVARKIRSGATHIPCQECESRIELWDDLEREFGSDDLRARVLREDRRVQAVIERETRTQIIIADVIATVGRAGQLARQVDRPSPGVQITFVDDHGKPTDKRAFVHVNPDPLPDTEVIGVDPAWADHPHPLLYAVRAGDDDPVQWMDATTALRTAQADAAGATGSLPFTGRRFDVLSVRELRDRLLTQASSGTAEPATPVGTKRGGGGHTHNEQDGSTTAQPSPAPPPDTARREERPEEGVSPTRLWNQVWAWVVAAATIASLVGLGLAIAALL